MRDSGVGSIAAICSNTSTNKSINIELRFRVTVGGQEMGDTDGRIARFLV